MGTVRDYRRSNMQLIEHMPSQAAFEDKVGMARSYASQIAQKTREMGDKTARKIEQAFGLDRGQMDRPNLGDQDAFSSPEERETLEHNRQMWIAEVKRRKLLSPGEWKLVEERAIAAGMGVCALYASWGEPGRTAPSSPGSPTSSTSTRACTAAAPSSFTPRTAWSPVGRPPPAGRSPPGPSPRASRPPARHRVASSQ